MIVRILGEGQFELQESQIASLEELDQKLVAAARQGDMGAFEYAVRSAATVRDALDASARCIRLVNDTLAVSQAP